MQAPTMLWRGLSMRHNCVPSSIRSHVHVRSAPFLCHCSCLKQLTCSMQPGAEAAMPRGPNRAEMITSRSSCAYMGGSARPSIYACIRGRVSIEGAPTVRPHLAEDWPMHICTCVSATIKRASCSRWMAATQQRAGCRVLGFRTEPANADGPRCKSGGGAHPRTGRRWRRTGRCTRASACSPQSCAPRSAAGGTPRRGGAAPARTRRARPAPPAAPPRGSAAAAACWPPARRPDPPRWAPAARNSCVWGCAHVVSFFFPVKGDGLKAHAVRQASQSACAAAPCWRPPERCNLYTTLGFSCVNLHLARQKRQ